MGCGGDAGPKEDRRFANDPSTEIASHPTEARPATQPSRPTSEPLASPESLLHTRGGADVVFAIVDDSVEIIDSGPNGGIAHVAPEAGAHFLDVAVAPGGRQAAVLVSATAESGGTKYAVTTYDASGTEVSRWSDLDALAGIDREDMATPAAEQEPNPIPPGALTWSSDGQRLLVTLGGSKFVSIDVAGEAVLLDIPVRVQGIRRASWSPSGYQIAMLAENAEGSGAIWVFNPNVDGDSLRQVVPPNADASNLGSVTDFEWLPDGSGFIYNLAEDTSAGNTGGQLYEFDLQSRSRRIVATPGRGGPAARIVDFTVSPDGGAVAYVIAAPTEDQWSFHSLWIRSLRDNNMYNVPTGNVDEVSGVWWVDSGIVWQQQRGETVEFVAANDAGQTSVLASSADIGATPVSGTPQASPVTPSTPVEATPAATPERSAPRV